MSDPARIHSPTVLRHPGASCPAAKVIRSSTLQLSPLALGTLIAMWSACIAPHDAVDPSRFDGSWVLEGDSNPMAMEVADAGSDELAGSIVGAVGGRAQPFLEASVSDGQLRFRVEREFDGGTRVGSTTVAWFESGLLVGETLREDSPHKRLWSGRRPAVVTDVDNGDWVEQEPVVLFDGSGLSGWHAAEADHPEGWSVKDGILRSAGNAPNLVSDLEFWNFRLQVEYRVARGGNSGIGLRGRYEVQILDDHGLEPSIHGNGAIYSRIEPRSVATKHHSEWQVFDIRLIGREVTIVLNGTTTINRQVIQGLTAIARDARESEPGPVVLQGDHGPIEFRSLIAIPLRRG